MFTSGWAWRRFGVMVSIRYPVTGRAACKGELIWCNELGQCLSQPDHTASERVNAPDTESNTPLAKIISVDPTMNPGTHICLPSANTVGTGIQRPLTKPLFRLGE